MAQNENFIEAFKRAVGKHIETATGLSEVYHERASGAKYPRAVFFFTVWAEDNEQRGTLTIRLAGNTTAAELDGIAQEALNSLDGAVYNDKKIYYYLHSARMSPVEDQDKTITRRLITIEFRAIEKGSL